MGNVENPIYVGGGIGDDEDLKRCYDIGIQGVLIGTRRGGLNERFSVIFLKFFTVLVYLIYFLKLFIILAYSCIRFRLFGIPKCKIQFLGKNYRIFIEISKNLGHRKKNRK